MGKNVDIEESVDALKVMFFGAGGRLRQFKGRFSGSFNKDQVIGVLDNDSKKHGDSILGLEIYSIDSIMNLKPDLIVVTSIYSKEILYQLALYSLINKIKFYAIVN